MSDSAPRHPEFFPPASSANPDGMVGYGGSLEPEWLLDAYSHGIFPWPDSDDEPIFWWSPDPRAVFEPEHLHLSRRLRRRLRSGQFRVTCDQDFAGVMTGCASAPTRRGGTWITPNMKAAYQKMHQLGHAHSVEAWHEGQLVGGVYGLAIGGLFAAESMFYYRTDASKVAVAHLIKHLESRGYGLIDIQQYTDHTGSLGAVEISRDEYLRQLDAVIDLPVTFGSELEVGEW